MSPGCPEPGGHIPGPAGGAGRGAGRGAGHGAGLVPLVVGSPFVHEANIFTVWETVFFVCFCRR